MKDHHQLSNEIRLVGKVAVSLCFALLPPTSANAQGQHFFDPPVFPISGYAFEKPVVADFNADGKADVAVLDAGTAEVGIFLGHGDGTFSEELTSDTGGGAYGIVVGEFNGDGRLDIVTFDVQGAATEVNVFLGNGNGRFNLPRRFNAGPDPRAIAVGDFNRDGKQDLAVTNFSFGVGQVSVLLANDDGSLSEPVAYNTATGALSIVAGDFNNDGKIDLAIESYLKQVVSILLGNGDGTFEKRQDFAAGDSPSRLEVGDFNGDSKLDFVTGGYSEYAPAFHILLGNGDGTFQAPIETATFESPELLAVGDLDGDGLADLAMLGFSTSTTVTIFHSNGDGTFRLGMSYGEAVMIALGDFDRNETMDLVGLFNRSPDPGIMVIAGNGDGTFRARTELRSRNNSQTERVGDLNGDGKPDIVTSVYYYNVVSVFLNDGEGNFPTRVDYPTGTNPWGIALGDVNNDENTDLAVTNNEGPNYSVSILLGNGDGTFQPKSDFPTDSEPRGIVLADFNGDGNLDVATANQINFYFFDPGSVSLLFGHGDGTFSAHQEIRAGDEPWSIASDDLNGDRNSDLVVTYASNTTVLEAVSVFLNNGDGTFQSRVDYPLQQGQSSGVTTGDINQDGKPDLVVSSQVGFLALFLGNGDGTFQSELDYPVNTASTSCVVGDFNVDGNPDVATGDIGYYNNLGTISLLLGNGDGTFQPYLKYLAGSPYSVSAGDLNGDGALDLTSSNVYGDSVSIFYNLGGSRVSLVSSRNPSQAGEPVTFTAKIKPTIDSVIPSGEVEFFDGGTVLGTVTLDGNTATLPWTTNQVGTHKIRANYLGDSTFVPIRSKTLLQKVRPWVSLAAKSR